MIGRPLGLLIAAATLLPLDPGPLLFRGEIGVTSAEARIGRPATPRSVAGVARRTTRRTVRRTALYISALPAGCGRATLYGAAVWRCGGTYYQSSGTRYVVVVAD